MGKSILVMDTPECCEKCPFCKGLNACKVMKYLNGDRITTIYTVDKQIFDGTKPEWCPLQDAPEKKDKIPTTMSMKADMRTAGMTVSDPFWTLTITRIPKYEQKKIVRIAFVLPVLIRPNAVRIVKGLYETAKSAMRHILRF